MLLGGCSSTEIQYIQVPVPSEFTRPFVLPEIPNDFTFGQSVELNIELMGVLEQCNIHRLAVRELNNK